MPTDEMSLPAMLRKSSADLHGGLASGVRSEIRGEPAHGRRAERISRRRQPTAGKFGSFGLAEDGVGGNETRIPADCIGIRNMIAALIEGAIYEFREGLTRALHALGSNATLRELNVAAKRTRAGRWIFGDGPKAFGFRWSCMVLDLEPERVRHALLTTTVFRRKYAIKANYHGLR